MASAPTERTPQGGPLSPLSNILLPDLDRELEKRRHRFCRYADDCNIYVGSKRSGGAGDGGDHGVSGAATEAEGQRRDERVARPWQRKFLGYSMTWHREPKLRIAEISRQRFAEKVRKALRAGRGRNLKRLIEDVNPQLRGWVSYFRLTEVKGVLEELMVGSDISCGRCSGGSGNAITDGHGI